MATAIYAFAQFSDGTFGSFANASVSVETSTEILTGGVGINQSSGVSIGQAFAGKTCVALSCQVQTDDAVTGSFSYAYLLGPTGEMLCPVQGGNFGGVGLPRLKRPVRMAPGVKLFAAFDTVSDAVSLAAMAVYCSSGKSAIFSVKAVDAVKTSMTDVLTGATIGQSLAGQPDLLLTQGHIFRAALLGLNTQLQSQSVRTTLYRRWLGCDSVALSKRAKARLKMASVTDKKKVAAAAKVLFDNELMGVKRANEIQRFVKRC